jgi:hypothetical protein
LSTDTDSHDPLEPWLLAIGPWRPRPLSRPDPPMPRRRRAAIVSALVLGHVLAIVVLVAGTRPDDEKQRDITTLVFLTPPPAPEPEPEPVVAPAPTTVPPRPAPATPPRAVPTPPTSPTSPRRDRPMVAVAPTPRPPADAAPLRLFEGDGSVSLPDDVVARLDEVTSDQRTFDFQLPGLMESGTFMDRPPAMVYEATRFDRYWKPDQDALSALLEEMVKKTTGSIEIPIPGSPGSKIVCTASVLAFGGGCGIVNNNDGYVPVVDDPATLDEAEERQCQAWWEQIVAAKGQDAWRHTRELYEFSCRKPREQALDPP